MITIKMEPNNSSMRKPCFCCGQPERPYESMAVVYEDDNKVGHVCIGCISDGQEAVAQTMKARAGRLRDHAAYLEVVADFGMPLPSKDAFQAAVRTEAICYLMDVADEDRLTAERKISESYPFEALAGAG